MKMSNLFREFEKYFYIFLLRFRIAMYVPILEYRPSLSGRPFRKDKEIVKFCVDSRVIP